MTWILTSLLLACVVVVGELLYGNERVYGSLALTTVASRRDCGANGFQTTPHDVNHALIGWDSRD